MNDHSTEGQRGQADRRKRPTSPLDAFRPSGRRVRPRRSEERHSAFFTDRFEAVALVMVVTLLILTTVDGVLTIELLDINSEEANPLMWRLLKEGPHAFLVGKYVLTAMGLPFLIVYKNYPLFNTRFRVGFLLPVFISMYLVLISYQCILFQAGRIDSPIIWSDAALTADSRSGAPGIEVQGNPQKRRVP